VEAIAGICDASGRIFGLMPHPEAFNHPANHPSWTRLKALPDKGDGMAIFENAVGFLKGIV
jgi:phosphoribosylformylglycinamidine synthase